MKKLILCVLLMVVIANAQQNVANWSSVGLFEYWQAREDSTLNTRIYISGVDSVWTEPMLSWPYMSLDIVAGDTAALTDSIKAVVELWMWHQSRSASYTDKITDKGRFCFVKALTFNTTNRINTSLSSITAAGAYQSIVTGSAIPNVPFYRFRIRTESGNAVLPGAYFELTPSVFRGR
jgi:hypothetical protein